jgi:RNA polymerase alpha subunit
MSALMNQRLDAGPRDSLSRPSRSRTTLCRLREGRPLNGKRLAMIDPSPELPDDMSIANVELPPKVQQALIAAGLRTVGDVREAPDTKILEIQDLGENSLAHLRKTWGCHLH